MLLILSILFRYWLFASAFATIYIMFNALLDSINGFHQIYSSLDDCLAFTRGGRHIAPTVRSIIVTVLALIFLRVQQVNIAILWPRSWMDIPDANANPAEAAPTVDLTAQDEGIENPDEVEIVNEFQEGVVDIDENPEEVDDDDNLEEVVVDADELSTRNANVYRFLGRYAFVRVRRRLLQHFGRFPPLDTFPLLNAQTLRPYNRFTDPRLYDNDLLSLVRPSYRNYPGIQTRIVGSVAFFAEVDRLLAVMDRPTVNAPLPIAFQRHPALIHSHQFMGHRDSLSAMTDIVFTYQDLMRTVSPIYSPLHREVRLLIIYLLYLIGRFDQAASYGDFLNSIRCLELIDNVTTSLLGLCEIEYSVREEARRAGF